MATVQAPSEWASQAALDSLLRYQPQLEGLSILKQQAEERAAESKQAGVTEGTLGTQAASQALPAVQAIYAKARAEDARNRSLLASANLPANSPFAVAAGNEQAAGQERLQEAQSRNESDLQARKVAAASAPAFADQAALSKLAKELQSITRRESSVRGSEGLATAAELLKLRGEADKLLTTENVNTAKDTTSEANNQRTTGASENNNKRTTSTSRTNSAETNAARREGNQLHYAGTPKLTATQQDKGISLAAEIAHYAGESGGSRAERVAALTEGRPEESVKNAKGETVKVPKIPAFKPDALMSAGLDAAELHFLKPHTVNALQQMGYSPAAIAQQLGVPLNAPRNSAPPVTAAPGNHHGA